MKTRILRLVYPTSLIRQPILFKLIKQSDLTVNIRQARISLEEGWLEVEIKGEPDEVERAITWLQSEGIEVLPAD
jgi:hypothetical protein